MPNRESRHLALACTLFMASGAIAVVYEVLWMRRATTVFGASAPAAATVLSTFFAGLALGAVWLGGLAARTRRPLFVYGGLELAAAITALAVEPLLGVIQQFLALLPPLHGGGATALRMMLSLVLFLPTTVLLGGTFPALAHGFAGRRLTWLYAFNTAGAVIGALGVPFVLLPAFGVGVALAVAAGAGAAVGVVAMVWGRRALPPVPDAAVETGGSATSSRPMLALAFGSGFFVLGFETLAFRAAALVHSNSTHAFAVVLALVLLALALGAGAVGVLGARGIEPARVTRPALVASGVLVVLAPPLFLWATGGLAYLGDTVGEVSPRLLGALLLLVLPVAGTAGMVLPSLLGSLRRGVVGGRVIGQLLAWNTLGAIAGPVVTSFVLMPRWGLWSTHLLLGLVPLLLVAVTSSRNWRLTLGVLGGVLILTRPGRLPVVRLDAALGQHVVALREGVLGSVAVIDDRDGDRRIAIDNYYVLGGTASTTEERLQGHLPLLLHPAPRRVAFLGLGTGITVAAATFHDPERVVAIELVAEVVSAAANEMWQANLEIASRPEFEIVVDDARAFLAADGEPFDVVIGDLFVPWRCGEASLYTREAFASARRRLAPAGLFCQWFPSYQLNAEEIALLVRTFRAVFPRATLWRGDFSPAGAALALCGEGDGYRLDPARIDRTLLAASRRMVESAPVLSDPDGLWLHFLGRLVVGSEETLALPLNTDREPLLELGELRRVERDRAAIGSRGSAATEAALRVLPLAAEAMMALELGAEPARAWRAGRLLGAAAAAAASSDLAAADRLGREAMSALTTSGRSALLQRLPATSPGH